MDKTLVVFGSSTGSCEDYARRIAERISAEVINVTDLNADMLGGYDCLLLGTSTWGAGEMQDDWYDGVKVLKSAGLSGKTVALFGVGDAESYSDTFCGGLKELYDTCVEAGAKVLDGVDASAYTYDDSEAVVDGKFLGLALDETNEDDKTPGRIDAWLAQITPSL